MATSIPPLQLADKLFGNPQNPPRWSLDVRRRDGSSLQVADPRATRAMVALMDMRAQLGGAASHWGGPSAFAELMSSVHALMFMDAQTASKKWSERFTFVNDAGHCENGLYALQANYGFLTPAELNAFRSIESSLTGHGEAHLYPQGVVISNGPLGSALPQAQGLAMADRLAGLERMTICAVSDGGCMEGEAREALAAIPGFAGKGRMAPFLLLVSDNNTKLSGRIDEQSFSMGPTFRSLEALGWHVVSLESGNDLPAALRSVEEAMQAAWAKPERPVVVHARTIKGIGVKSTAQSSSGGHGFPCKNVADLQSFLQEIYTGHEVPNPFVAWAEELAAVERRPSAAKVVSSVRSEKVQAGVSRALVRQRAAGLPLVSVTSDLPGSTGVAEFQTQFPEATIDVGVAEANMISVAAGFSRRGFIPVVDTFSQFAVTKGALPFTMAQLSLAPVVAILSHAGFQDAADGASHQALSYFAMVGSIPGTKVFSLSCSDEAEALIDQTIEEFHRCRRSGVVPPQSIFFLGRENFPSRYADSIRYEVGKAQILLDTSVVGPAVTIVACGPMVPVALEAAEILRSRGQGAVVINASIINLPDVPTIASSLRRTGGRLITIEDHQIIGGMGAQLVHALTRDGVGLRYQGLGVRGEFGQSAYAARELYAKHGLTAAAVAQAAHGLAQESS